MILRPVSQCQLEPSRRFRRNALSPRSASGWIAHPQQVDRQSEVERLPEPEGRAGVGAGDDSPASMLTLEIRAGVFSQVRRLRHRRKPPPVRPPELGPTAPVQLDPEAILMHGSVMEAALFRLPDYSELEVNADVGCAVESE